jgi:anaerobic selenocysteine-containing dehydrogenase
VHVSTKLNRSHAVPGATSLILPCLGRTEVDQQATGPQFVTVEDSMSCVHSSQGALTPASDELLSEVSIICRLARELLGDALPWSAWEDDYRLVRRLISEHIPGFADFETRVAVPGGFTLPHPPRDSRTFATRDGKAHFTVSPLATLWVPDGRLLLQSVRSHDQYNTTIYGLDDRYRGVRHGRRVVFVNPEDLASLGVADGSYVDIISEWPGDADRVATQFRVVAYPTARGCAATYFPEANILVPLDATAAESNTPMSKQIIVRLRPAEAPS